MRQDGVDCFVMPIRRSQDGSGTRRAGNRSDLQVGSHKSMGPIFVLSNAVVAGGVQELQVVSDAARELFGSATVFSSLAAGFAAAGLSLDQAESMAEAAFSAITARVAWRCFRRR